MRLIDADKLKKKIRHWNYNATTSTPTFSFVIEEDIDYMPTVDVLDKIRDEIVEEQSCWREDADAEWHECRRILRIIDKYRGNKNEI